MVKGKGKILNVHLNEEDISRLEEIAAKKFRIPGNKSHTIRLLIEDAFREIEKEGK